MTFAYFESELGLQFLMDQGELDPERKLLASAAPAKQRLPASAQKKKKQRSPWNPRLVGEEGEPEEQNPQDMEPVLEEGYQEDMWMPAPGAMVHEHSATEEPPFQPATRLPIQPEEYQTPGGPHPDKKDATWDIYGQQRPPRPPIARAYVALNREFLEVEGATDRRVRTV